MKGAAVIFTEEEMVRSNYREIPLWLARLDLNYGFWIGCHGNTYNEVICYAIPKDDGAIGDEG
ncbi:MAG: hypothetical protein LBU23_11540 [Planctomycetota bacterium]|jgi:hypothetical protein|nr:hypothetical protein [Planctomycetota bacterium]